MSMLRRSKKKAGYNAVTDGDLRQPIGLGEFMHGLGVVMRLPRRRPAAAPVVEGEERQTPRSLTIVISLTLASIILLGVGVSALTPTSSDPLPPALMGSWHAASPKYADRGLEFRDGALFMKRGAEDGDLVRLVIQRVRVTPRNSSLGVEIAYLEDGATLTLDLTLHDYGGMPVVELRNMPDVIWRKDAAATPRSFPDMLPPELRQ